MKPCSDVELPPCILVVDENAESRAVFRTVFERRGVQFVEATNARRGLELLRLHHPRVVVLDLESQQADDESLRDQYDTESRTSQASLVVLGKARRYETLPKDHVVAKPYHYGPLIRTIERLL